jgi:phospholipid/cholesterol/gamma-HCH transport system substrate-binding protein
METRANNALIGLFTLAVIGAALGFVVWFARLAEGTQVEKYQIVFSGSITGLSVGSSVLFNGIRVGQVDSLDLLPEDPSRVVAVVTVNASTPIKVDTRARMEFQGLTGGAYIQLYGGSASAPPLDPPPEQAMATIYAERSELQNLVDGARDTVTQAAQTLTRIDEFIRANESSLTSTVNNVQSFTKALSDNSDNVSEFLASTGKAAESIARLSDSLNGMSGDVEALLKAVDPAKIEQVISNVTAASDQLQRFVAGFDPAIAATTLDNVRQFSEALAASREPIESFTRDAAAVASRLTTMAPKLEASLDSVQRVTAAVDPAKIEQTIASVADTTAQAQRFMQALDPQKAQQTLDNVAEFSNGLAVARAPLESFANEASALATRLNSMAPKLDATLDSLQQATASLDGEKIGRTVDNVERLSATLGSNTAEIDAFLKDARKVSGDLAAMTPKLGDAFDNFNRVATAIDPQKIDRVVGNVDRFAATLGDSTQKVQGFIDDASEVGRKLNSTADRLDVVMKNIESMTTSPEGRGMFAEISETAKSIRTLADNLDKRTAELTKNLNQFTGPGLRDYRELAVDGQKTLRDIQRTLNSLNRNPQQLIFGPRNTIPEYRGQ